MERVLHHFPLDPASRQVRLALGEKRLNFTEVQVRYWERPPSFVALNPSGLTPVLVEGALVVVESRAILEHIEESAPEPSLLGREAGDRAEARRLVQWFDRKFDFDVNALMLHEKMEKRLLGMGAPDLSALRRGREAGREGSCPDDVDSTSDVRVKDCHASSARARSDDGMAPALTSDEQSPASGAELLVCRRRNRHSCATRMASRPVATRRG